MRACVIRTQTSEARHKEGFCLSQCSTAVKSHCDHSNSYKRTHLIGAGLQFKSYDSSVQADMVLGK